MPHYHLWTIGCQMNKAESSRIAGLLDAAGLQPCSSFDGADVVVLNTCVVRQSAEGRIIGTLGLLEGVKREHPETSIVVTGCFASLDTQELSRRFPHVDLFFGPGGYEVLEEWLSRHFAATKTVDAGCLPSSLTESSPGVSAYIPIIQGCNNFCAYCIVPYTRGREVSRLPEEILAEVELLVASGTKEVVLLGQNVDSYGHDLPGSPDLADLLVQMNSMEELKRIRFLTNHPKDMSRKLIETMASVDKVCEHLDLALQSGDDDILRAMRRRYSVADYATLMGNIRAAMPSVSISTDIIVGFPGETEEQFQHTYDALAELKFDVVHVAMYSPRKGTLAHREYVDSVPQEVKKERLHRVEALQERVAGIINAGYVGTIEEVLIQGKRRGRWFGRTRTDKLVFLTSGDAAEGRFVHVNITRSSPWALQGDLINDTEQESRR